MKQFVFTAFTVGVLVIASSSWRVRGAGTNATAEAEIRRLVLLGDQGQAPPRTSASIFWSGGYKRPFVRPATGEPNPGPGRVPGSQKEKTDIIRIVVADSGDLAYEYSKANLQYDSSSGEHHSFDLG